MGGKKGSSTMNQAVIRNVKKKKNCPPTENSRKTFGLNFMQLQ